MFRKNVILFIVVSVTASCVGQDDKICTTEFVMVTVEIVDQDNIQFDLDSTQTKLPNGDLLLSQYESFYESRFTVVSDSERNKLSKKGTKLTLLGWKDGNQMFSQEFIVGSDDCHIGFIEGPQKILL